MEVEDKTVELERELEGVWRELASAQAEAARGRFFRKIVEASTDVISVILADGRATFVSPAFEAVTGTPGGELLGRELGERIHPDDIDRVRAALKGAVEEPPDRAHRVVFRRMHADGRWIEVEASARNLLADPDVRGIVVSSREIGEAVRLREALRNSERMFRALFEDTSVAVTIRDTSTQKFVDCNPAALRLYGFASREELYGTTPDQLAPPVQPDGQASTDVLRAYVQRALHDGVARMEWNAQRRNGETFPADVRTTVIVLEDGRKVMQTLIEDVTERRRNENALRYGARRDDLVSRVSRRFVEGPAETAVPFALEALGVFLGASRARVRRFSEDGAALVTHEEWRAAGVPPFPFVRQEASHPIVRFTAEEIARNGFYVVNDTDLVPPEIFTARPTPQPMRALLVVPMESQGSTRGWVVLDDVERPRAWTNDDVSAARLVAEIIAMGSARAEAEAKTQRRAARDELLSGVSRRFLNDDPEAATGATVEAVGVTLRADRVSLFTLDERAPRLRCTHRWSARTEDGAFESLEDYPVPVGAFAPVGDTSEPRPGHRAARRRERGCPSGSTRSSATPASVRTTPRWDTAGASSGCSPSALGRGLRGWRTTRRRSG